MHGISHLRSWRSRLVVAMAAGACQLAAAAAGDDTVASYSHLLPLTISGKEAVVQLRLPKAVYLNARSQDLRDLRVFDARGVAQAFALVEPAPLSATSHRTLPVKIFALRERERQAGKDSGPAIRALADGSLVVLAPARAQGDTTSTLSGLVLDLRQPANGATAAAPLIDALRLTLPAGTSNYTARVELEVSDDLKQWDGVGATLLSWLSNTTTDTLASDRIEFAPMQVRYARLRWTEGVPIEFASISAESPTGTDRGIALDQLTLPASAGAVGQDLLYQSAIAIPVQAIGMQFSEPNMVIPAQLGQYRARPARQDGKPTTLQFVAGFRATFYQLSHAGKQRASGDFALPRVHQAQWVVRPDTATASKPVLRLSWSPATVVFMAAGQPPYTLAVGRDNAAAANVAVGLVAPGFTSAELASLERAVAGPVQVQHVLGPPPDGAAVAGMSAQVRAALLWGVLLLGLAILGTMVWQLVKQMR